MDDRESHFTESAHLSPRSESLPLRTPREILYIKVPYCNYDRSTQISLGVPPIPPPRNFRRTYIELGRKRGDLWEFSLNHSHLISEDPEAQRPTQVVILIEQGQERVAEVILPSPLGTRLITLLSDGEREHFDCEGFIARLYGLGEYAEGQSGGGLGVFRKLFSGCEELEVGDVLFMSDKEESLDPSYSGNPATRFGYHFALHIGEGLFLSKLGGNPLAVGSLRAMKRFYSDLKYVSIVDIERFVREGMPRIQQGKALFDDPSSINESLQAFRIRVFEALTRGSP